MTESPIFDAMIPLRSCGLKRGEEGEKCYFRDGERRSFSEGVDITDVRARRVHGRAHGICD